MAIFDNASFDLWKPGIIAINGAFDSGKADFGLYKSYITY
jgi:hypothetical protein